MASRVRSVILAAGAAAFISSQAAYAAPAATQALDPLVTLSALGTAQSRQAVCAAGSAAASAAATAAAQGAGQNCVLPITGETPPPAAEAAPPPPPGAVAPMETSAGSPIGTWGLLIGLAALAGIIALIVTSNDNRAVTPISPA